MLILLLGIILILTFAFVFTFSNVLCEPIKLSIII